MAGEATTFSAQSYFDAIVALGAVPVVSDLQGATAFAQLQAQFNALVGAGGGGGSWALQSAQNWAPADNTISNDLGPTIFPLGSPIGAVSDADTPDGTLFRFIAGGEAEQNNVGQLNFLIALNFLSGTRLAPGTILLPATTAISVYWRMQIDGKFNGDGASREVVYTATIAAFDTAGLAALPRPVAAQTIGSTGFPVGAVDSFRIDGQMNAADPAKILRLEYASLEYLVP